ncbi:MAG TPA: HAMP domain-containing sensor histidine kinase [Thermoleophilaceae bacterium]|nr:HAMP domain-containing sensor histidine kinase [Thermoleophilaceae bacterium]
MTRPSLRNKLLLLFFGITALAFSVIYFVVVPQLESNLKDQKLADLKRAAKGTQERFSALIGRDVPAPIVDRRVRAAAEATDSRVTLLSIQQSLTGSGEQGSLRFFVLSDSGEEREVPSQPAIARRAVEKRRVTTGFGELNGVEVGQVAQPIDYRGEPGWVALYSRDLGDVAETVSFVRERVLLATAVALLVALIGGYFVAHALARRVRRLEGSVKQVATGCFIDPLPVDSEDELGQLTRAFNEMQQKLRQVDVARKEFVATASHELRTPIFSLAGFVELLQDEELDEDTRREFLETMGEQVARLQKLSVDLLDLSRLDAGSVELEREAVDLSELARSVVGEFKPALSEHGTELQVELPEDGVAVTCDPERVAQIMRILLDNALRHTPEGTEVTVSAERHNGAAELTVADTGPGVGDGAVSHVFERFYTGDAARGAGLGLAIAQELAERMQGRITLSSQAGATTFRLELPSPDGDAA